MSRTVGSCRNVLHVRTVVLPGGADKTTLKSPRYLKQLGYRAAAAYLRAGNDPGFEEVRARARAWDCPLVEIDDHGPLDLLAVWKLYRHCRQFDVGIWHSHEYKSNVIGLIIGRLLGLKLISTVHGWVEYDRRLKLYYKLDLWALRHYDRVVVVSEDLKRYCLAAKFAPDKLRLVENAIEVETFRRRLDPESARRQHAGRLLPAGRVCDPARRVIGAVGRLSKEKGLDYLIPAFASLSGSGFDTELWIAGEGRERPHLERLAADHGCSEKVVFLGQVADTIALFECFDLFCLPSIREGLPNVLLEAMAMEVPVVATDVGGIPSTFGESDVCEIVPAGSVDALKAAVSRILESPERKSDLARRARGLIEGNYDFGMRMKKIVAIYDELCGSEASHDDIAAPG